MKKSNVIKILFLTITMSLFFVACKSNIVHAPVTEYEPETNIEIVSPDISKEYEEVDIKYETQKTHDYPVMDTTIKISSIEEWNNYEFNKSLNDSFIKEELEKGQVIYIIQRQLSSGSITLDVKGTYKKENIIYAKISMESTGIGTCDMAGAFYIFSCDKTVTNVIEFLNITDTINK